MFEVYISGYVKINYFVMYLWKHTENPKEFISKMNNTLANLKAFVFEVGSSDAVSSLRKAT